MKTDNWNPYFKINHENGRLIESNLIYTPLINPENTILCMNFDHTHPYQNEGVKEHLPSRPYYTEEMVKFFFEREVKYLEIFKNKIWAPTILDVDFADQKIFLQWPGKNCNQSCFGGGDLDSECPNWKDQMTDIIKDIYNDGYYKITLYPHCYFIEGGILKTMDFYGCIEQQDPYIDFEKVKGLINVSAHRFEEALDERKRLNIEIMFKRSLTTYVYWPDNILPKIYTELFDQ
jgi:hypothetical protein